MPAFCYSMCFCVDMRVCVCALHFQKCHKQLFIQWAVCSRPPAPAPHAGETASAAESRAGGCQLGPARSCVWDGVL